MYSSTKSGLQRSRSSSSISQAFRLSRVPVRNSVQKNCGKTLFRSDKLSLDRNMTRSSSNLSEQPRLSRQRSGSLVRQTLATPLGSCRSSKKSPLMSSVRKDTRPIVDKRWQYEQTVKVSERSIRDILSQGQDVLKSSICSIRAKTDVFLNYTFRKDLQRQIWQYHLKNEHFTLDKLLADSRENLEYKGGRTTLFKIIKLMGYKHKMVRNFVAENLCHLDYNNIKTGIPLELFIAVIDCCFKLIDKRINITRVNYVDEVPVNLKRLRYPATVKPSLMKTVNTPHSWPHVVAILSWLIDVINQINSTVNHSSDFITLVDDCAAEWYIRWNRFRDDIGEDGADGSQSENPLHELDLQLEASLKTDKVEINLLDQELENLSAEIGTYAQKRKDGTEKIEELKANIKHVTEKCDFYASENEKYETQMKEQCAKYATKIQKVDQELPSFLKSEEQLKAVVASQPHSFTEKQQVAQQIKDLHGTLTLKEARLTQHRELLQTYDFKSVDIKQQTEANAYQYNNVINQLQLIYPEFKELHIRESGFHRNDTEHEIQEALQLLTEATFKLEQKLDLSNKEIEELNQKQIEINEKLVSVKREEEKASKLEAELHIAHSHKLKKDEIEKGKALAEIDKYQDKLLKLQNSKYDLTPLQRKLKELQSKKSEYLNFKQDLLDRALDFFLKLEVRMSNNLQAYMDIMEGITADMMLAQEKAIADSTARIEKLRRTREEAECEGSMIN